MAKLFPNFESFLSISKLSMESLLSDIIAGLTVGLTVIPQGIAYASIAGLPTQYGLFSGFMGCFLYVFLGSCKDITVGPTAIMAIMTHQHAHKGTPFVTLLTFLSGIIIFLFGIFKLGFLIDFISIPVISGFTSAAAITIATTQIKGLFGLDIHHDTNSSEGFVNDWSDIFDNIATIRYQDSVLSLICIVLLLTLRSLKSVFPNNYPMRFISTCRNALIVLIASLVAYGFNPKPDYDNPRNNVFILTGKIDYPGGLPPFNFPDFSANIKSDGHLIHLNFIGMLRELGSSIIIIPLISILESVAIAKAFSEGEEVDASQEMLALGMGNFFGSFFSSMPVTGSFSRTAVNHASGVKSTIGGLFTGALVLVALGVLMPFCQFIPKAALSSVIITAVIFSIQYKVIKPIWKSKKSDLLPWIGTFLGCLFWALEYGIILGICINILIILYNTARPKISAQVHELNPDQKYVIVYLDRSLSYPSISYVRSIIHEISKSTQNDYKIPLVMDCLRINYVDYTVAKGFMSLVEELSRNHPIIMFRANESVANTINALIDDEKVNLIWIAYQDELELCLEQLLPVITSPSTSPTPNE